MIYETLYSAFEDDWEAADYSLEEVATCCLDDMSDSERSDVSTLILYKGILKPAQFKDFLHVKEIFDYLQEFAESVGTPPINITELQVKELEDLIVDWAKRNDISPSWLTVDSIEEIEFTVPEEWK